MTIEDAAVQARIVARADGMTEVRPADWRPVDPAPLAALDLGGGLAVLDLDRPGAALQVLVADATSAGDWLDALLGPDAAAAVARVAVTAEDEDAVVLPTPFAAFVAEAAAAGFLERWWPIVTGLVAPAGWLLDVEAGARAAAAVPDTRDADRGRRLVLRHAAQVAAAVQRGDDGFRPGDELHGLLEEVLDADDDPAAAELLGAMRAGAGAGAQSPVVEEVVVGTPPTGAGWAPVLLDQRTLPPRLLRLDGARWRREGDSAVVRAVLAGPPDPRARLYARVMSGATTWVGTPMTPHGDGVEARIALPPGADLADAQAEIYDGRYFGSRPERQRLDDGAAWTAVVERVVRRRLAAVIERRDATAGPVPLLAEIEAAGRALVRDVERWRAVWSARTDAVPAALAGARGTRDEAPEDAEWAPREWVLADLPTREAVLGRAPRPIRSVRDRGEPAPTLRVGSAGPGRLRVEIVGVVDVRRTGGIRVVAAGVVVPLVLDPSADHGRPAFVGEVDAELAAEDLDCIAPRIEVTDD